MTEGRIPSFKDQLFGWGVGLVYLSTIWLFEYYMVVWVLYGCLRTIWLFQHYGCLSTTWLEHKIRLVCLSITWLFEYYMVVWVLYGCLSIIWLFEYYMVGAWNETCCRWMTHFDPCSVREKTSTQPFTASHKWCLNITIMYQTKICSVSVAFCLRNRWNYEAQMSQLWPEMNQNDLINHKKFGRNSFVIDHFAVGIC